MQTKIISLFFVASIGLLSVEALQQECSNGFMSLFNSAPCANDLKCQNLATGFFCLQRRCCAHIVPPASGYGSSCNWDSDCRLPNAECRRNVCYCCVGFKYDGAACLPRVVYDTFANGDGRAGNTLGTVCTANQVNINGNCYGLVGFGGFCDSSRQCDFPGGFCRLNRCVCGTGQVFDGGARRCVNDPKTASNVPCIPSMIRINDLCYPLSEVGEPCAYDLQCQSPFRDRALYCGNFVCRYADTTTPTINSWKLFPWHLEFPVCRNPSAEVEIADGVPKDCIYQRCSPGYHCEYNRSYKGSQYICCGASLANLIYGQPKMYPGYANLPLECHGLNSCTFVDYPYCVYSESYRHNLCCSKPQCL